MSKALNDIPTSAAPDIEKSTSQVPTSAASELKAPDISQSSTSDKMIVQKTGTSQLPSSKAAVLKAPEINQSTSSKQVPASAADVLKAPVYKDTSNPFLKVTDKGLYKYTGLDHLTEKQKQRNYYLIKIII